MSTYCRTVGVYRRYRNLPSAKPPNPKKQQQLRPTWFWLLNTCFPVAGSSTRKGQNSNRIPRSGTERISGSKSGNVTYRQKSERRTGVAASGLHPTGYIASALTLTRIGPAIQSLTPNQMTVGLRRFSAEELRVRADDTARSLDLEDESATINVKLAPVKLFGS